MGRQGSAEACCCVSQMAASLSAMCCAVRPSMLHIQQFSRPLTFMGVHTVDRQYNVMPKPGTDGT